MKAKSADLPTIHLFWAIHANADGDETFLIRTQFSSANNTINIPQHPATEEGEDVFIPSDLLPLFTTEVEGK